MMLLLLPLLLLLLLVFAELLLLLKMLMMLLLLMSRHLVAHLKLQIGGGLDEGGERAVAHGQVIQAPSPHKLAVCAADDPGLDVTDVELHVDDVLRRAAELRGNDAEERGAVPFAGRSLSGTR